MQQPVLLALENEQQYINCKSYNGRQLYAVCGRLPVDGGRAPVWLIRRLISPLAADVESLQRGSRACTNYCTLVSRTFSVGQYIVQNWCTKLLGLRPIRWRRQRVDNIRGKWPVTYPRGSGRGRPPNVFDAPLIIIDAQSNLAKGRIAALPPVAAANEFVQSSPYVISIRQ